jgi:lipid-A-disaccharide synthase
VECVGYGGDKMAAAGCRILYPLCSLAVMWFVRVLANAHVFLELLSRADRYFCSQRPDAVVLIDYPGFNWWMARRAHFRGIPVFYFVPPQIWGWAGWRVNKMRRFVDHVLCSLPFEEDWYRERDVPAHYVGHPFFDELPQQQLDAAFLTSQQARPETIIGLLPGSRNQEVERNLSSLVRAAARIHAARPDTRFLVASFKPAQREYVEEYLRNRRLPIEVHTGRTPEIIHLAHSCIAVSGSVGLELLYRGTPAVVVYRPSRLVYHIGRRIATCRFISLVNLLADQELFPEFPTVNCEAEAVSKHILRWLNDPASYEKVREQLAGLRSQVAQAGACERAARYILGRLESEVRSAA